MCARDLIDFSGSIGVQRSKGIEVMVKDSGREGKDAVRSGRWILLAVLLIGIFLVAMRFPGFVRSVPLEFDWDHARGFRSISVEDPLPLPFYNTLVTVQAGPRISSLLRKSGWRSAKGRLSVRVSLYFFVVGLDREAFNTGIIDPKTTPLMHAAEDGSITHLERLIAEGADVNAQDPRSAGLDSSDARSHEGSGEGSGGASRGTSESHSQRS